MLMLNGDRNCEAGVRETHLNTSIVSSTLAFEARKGDVDDLKLTWLIGMVQGFERIHTSLN